MTVPPEGALEGAVTPGSGSVAPVERIVLVGFMASGKSSVGRILARRLGWRFIDADDRIEAKVGMTVPEIFDQRGEEAFREVERAVVAALLEESHLVIATGGGWAGRPGRMDALPEGTASVWLRVSAEESVRRAGSAWTRRPLLEGADPLSRARELLTEREPFYSQAGLHVDMERFSPTEAAERVASALGQVQAVPTAPVPPPVTSPPPSPPEGSPRGGDPSA